MTVIFIKVNSVENNRIIYQQSLINIKMLPREGDKWFGPNELVYRVDCIIWSMDLLSVYIGVEFIYISDNEAVVQEVVQIDSE